MNRPKVGASVRGVAMVMLCIVAHLALPASPVAAHAFLESSDPAANAVLPTAPQSVTLTFTEPLESSYSRAELFDATGAQVPGATSTIGPEPRSMTVADSAWSGQWHLFAPLAHPLDRRRAHRAGLPALYHRHRSRRAHRGAAGG